MFATGTEALWIGLAISAVGTAASAYSQAQAAGAQEDAANYNASVAEASAAQSQQQAAYEAERIRSRNRKIIGQQVAQYSAAGLLVSGGSAADVMYDSSVQGELDALATIYKGNVQATSQRNQAQLDRAEAKNIGASAPWMIGGTVLGGIASGVGLYGRISANNSLEAGRKAPTQPLIR